MYMYNVCTSTLCIVTVNDVHVSIHKWSIKYAFEYFSRFLNICIVTGFSIQLKTLTILVFYSKHV